METQCLTNIRSTCWPPANGSVILWVKKSPLL
jgi:hypothetical protein